jgi:hypothetical protein
MDENPYKSPPFQFGLVALLGGTALAGLALSAAMNDWLGELVFFLPIAIGIGYAFWTRGHVPSD